MPNNGPLNALISLLAISSSVPIRETFIASTVPAAPNARVTIRDRRTSAAPRPASPTRSERRPRANRPYRSTMTTEVQELIAESTLDSEAARIAAITRPTAPDGKAWDMKYGRILSVAYAEGRSWCVKYASSASPTNDRPNIHNTSPAALITYAWRESASDFVV